MRDQRESVCAFLKRIADFLEAHGRDEGGFGEETRRTFHADAERLRMLARQRYASRAKERSKPFARGDRVVVDVPGREQEYGIVATNPLRPDRICVRLDGRRSVNTYHVSFVRATPLGTPPDDGSPTP